MELILKKLTEIEHNLLENKSVFTIDDLARYLGVSKSFLYKKTASGQLPFYKPFGKIIIFKKSEILEALLANPISTADDIEQAAIDYLNTSFLRGGARGC